MPAVSGATRTDVLGAARYVDSLLAYRQQRDRIPGVQVAMLHDADVVLSAAHGMADLESPQPMTTAHRFRIASHSKTFTATAVVQLAEQGVLHLDDSVGDWIDELADTAIAAASRCASCWPTAAASSATGGTVTSGSSSASSPTPPDCYESPGRRRRARPQRALQVLQHRLLVARPSGRAGHRHVLRRARADALLLEPLGLSATTHDIDPARPGTTQPGTRRWPTPNDRLPIDHVATAAMAPATGFSSTATDLVRWAAAHFLGDARVLSDDAKRQMQHAEWSVEGAASAYGLGLPIAEPGGRRVLGHGGGFPGFITQTWFDPIERVAVAVLTNAIDGPARATGHRRDADRRPRRAATRRPSADDAAAERFCGRFANLWGVLRHRPLGGAPVPARPDGHRPARRAAPPARWSTSRPC